MRVAVVGAGFSGAVIGRVFAEAGHHVEVFDGRDHVAGNCHTSRDESSGVLVHRYGPHLFHTRHRPVYEYLTRFTDVRPNQHRVRTTSASGVYSMPLNLLSMNQFFGSRLGPGEMRELVFSKASAITAPRNFEEQALSMMGRELYEEFFAGYTAKQWGRHPTELPASILKRLPMRFTYDDRYFTDPYEVLPVDGYTAAVGRMLDHERIEVTLGSEMSASDLAGAYGHVFWTGPLDAYFEHSLGRLSYRTLDFEWQPVDGEFQGCSVMNYSEFDVAHTRIADHKYFEPWSERAASVIGIETSRECGAGDIPFYPVRLSDDQRLLMEYVEMAETCSGVSFLGRLGTYRYLDMDGTIHEALEASRRALQLLDDGRRLPAFFTDPLD